MIVYPFQERLISLFAILNLHINICFACQKVQYVTLHSNMVVNYHACESAWLSKRRCASFCVPDIWSTWSVWSNVNDLTTLRKVSCYWVPGIFRCTEQNITLRFGNFTSCNRHINVSSTRHTHTHTQRIAEMWSVGKCDTFTIALPQSPARWAHTHSTWKRAGMLGSGYMTLSCSSIFNQ